MARYRALPAILILWGCSDPHHPQLRAATQDYGMYGRVEDVARWAVTDCRAPAPLPPSLSASRDADTHGKKLYYLYARDAMAYHHARDVDQPDGQIVVKESWIPGEKRTKGPLYLMLKSQGEWIYATATPDGKEITASGKIASCMECHESESTRDRMFGVSSCAAAK